MKIHNAQGFPQGMTNNVRFTFCVDDTTHVVLSKTNRIGDTTYNV